MATTGDKILDTALSKVEISLLENRQICVFLENL